MHPIPYRLLLFFLLPILGFLTSSSWAQSQDRSAPASPDSTIQVMVLGTVHFANPGQDQINPRVGDVTTPERQAQIETIVDSLLAFRPTRVAVEWPRRDAGTLDSMYQAYRADRHELSRSERQQLGFRLAARSDHDRISAVDRQHPFPMDTVMAYAKAHQPSFLQYFQRYSRSVKTKLDSVGQQASVGDLLRFVNVPEWYEISLEPYMRMPEVGADSTHIGVRPVAAYYERNLHIFANLTAAVGPGDRVVLIFGAGHAPFLRSFVETHPGMRLVEPLGYL